MLLQELRKFEREINQRSFQQVQIHPAKTLDCLQKTTNCSYCQIISGVCDDLQSKIQEGAIKYNNLLMSSRNICDLIYEILEMHESEFENLQKEIREHRNHAQDIQTEYKAILDSKEIRINQFHGLILQKQQIIEQLQEHFTKIENKENLMELQNQQLQSACQILNQHRRDKSKLNVKLEAQNRELQSQKNRLCEENIILREKIYQLESQVEVLEANLLLNNITTPRIIENVNIPDSSQSDQSSSLKDEDQSMIEKSLTFRDSSSAQEARPSIDPMESFMGKRGNALRDIMNLSGQTNKYFNFTRQKAVRERMMDTQSSKKQFGEDSIEMARSAQEIRLHKKDENQYTSPFIKEKSEKRVFLQATEQKQQKNIKQFNIRESVCYEEEVQFSQPTNKKQTHISSIVQPQLNKSVDPYLAFFTLTVQCIKLNWKNMDEVANIDLSGQWQKIMSEGIQMHRWQKYLEKKMMEQVKSK